MDPKLSGRHLATHDQQNRKSACSLCSDYADGTHNGLDHHMRDQHPETVVRPDNAPCPGRSGSVPPYSHEEHGRTRKVRARPFACVACDGRYQGSNSLQLYNHIRRTHPRVWRSNELFSMPCMPSLSWCSSSVITRLLKSMDLNCRYTKWWSCCVHRPTSRYDSGLSIGLATFLRLTLVLDEDPSPWPSGLTYRASHNSHTFWVCRHVAAGSTVLFLILEPYPPLYFYQVHSCSSLDLVVSNITLKLTSFLPFQSLTCLLSLMCI